jgi:hypothetical protein
MVFSSATSRNGRGGRGMGLFSEDWGTLAVVLATVFGATWLTAFDGVPGGRYAVLPGLVMLFLMLDQIRFDRNPIVASLFAILLTTVLAFGAFKDRDHGRTGCDGEALGAPAPSGARIS